MILLRYDGLQLLAKQASVSHPFFISAWFFTEQLLGNDLSSLPSVVEDGGK
jgi:hypothetical protein